MASIHDASPLAKRRRLSNSATLTDTTTAHNEGAELEKEIKSGITAYVRPDVPGFSGVLKQRQGASS